jgi:hypothetical protein
LFLPAWYKYKKLRDKTVYMPVCYKNSDGFKFIAIKIYVVILCLLNTIMKTIKSIILSIAMLVAFTSANAQNAAVSTSINNVVTAYINVKNALFADNSKGAATRAKTLNTQINAVSTKDMSAEEQTTWKANVDKLNMDSKHISESASIDHQREHFASLSKNMYAVLKAIKVNTATIYWQYCPMKKSAWLSDVKDIENPYYGSEMANCGKTTETLAPAK